MNLDFDAVIDRKNTDSIKHDFAVRRGLPEDVLPLWVADMDFRSPPGVIDALISKSRHGIFGYSDSSRDYFDVLHDWFSDRFGWDVHESWLIKTPGIVYAIAQAIRALTRENDAVLIQEPVYYPFRNVIERNKRRVVVNELAYYNGVYTIDFEDFERKIVSENVRLFILCSPHNPVGRVWTAAELCRLGELCHQHGVIVISDEIHADFVYTGHRHSVFAALKPEFADFTVTCTAPTKTFNLAGLQISNIFVSNKAIKAAIANEIDKSGYSQVNVMGLVACRAAYKDGAPWLSDLLGYLTGNLDYLRHFLHQKLPQLRLVEPEGTYLCWLDCRALGLDDTALEKLIVHQAKLWLDGGTMFGRGGSGFQRINIACPRAVLQQALEQLRAAVISLV
ncbi:pyridoxal phosphate-dependent aminotransferase [Oscillospiraceae bacterium CM]|nr:pyridoxal phosphate-dependent aminotransferase [Oscillospiraceae bacterium CM]